MAFDPFDVALAVQRQTAAAQDPAAQIRLVAGPGSGKSFSIEDRAEHLLTILTPPNEIFATSFTRASTADLRTRIVAHCQSVGLQNSEHINVSTLHSLALRLMRLANLLAQYPVDPRVLDEWETRRWIDEEFARFATVTPGRARAIRRYHEALWSTGQQNPPNYVPATPPIAAHEQAQFVGYHAMQTRFWACVLLGEIIRACLQNIKPGIINPVQLLGMQQLIVDEYQDLNPMDLELFDSFIALGVTAFVAGDDDQSIYSFRYASPEGIQTFAARHPAAAQHVLVHCFRCTPAILLAAENLLTAFASPNRIPKQAVSLYASSQPPVPGHMHTWRFPSTPSEVAATAESCAQLIAAGVSPGEIMILLSNARLLGQPLYDALDNLALPYSPARGEPYSDTDPGRTVLSILRVLTDPDDLVAHRNLLGLMHGVGPGRCLDITTRCTIANMSARDLFYGAIPAGVLTPGLQSIVDRVRAVAQTVQGWKLDDPLALHRASIAQLVEDVRGSADKGDWELSTQGLSDDMTLTELRDYLFAENEDEMHLVIVGMHERLGLAPPPETNPDRIQVMTMHGAKGLSASVVFIPGMEDEIFPDPNVPSRPDSYWKARACCTCLSREARPRRSARCRPRVIRTGSSSTTPQAAMSPPWALRSLQETPDSQQTRPRRLRPRF